MKCKYLAAHLSLVGVAASVVLSACSASTGGWSGTADNGSSSSSSSGSGGSTGGSGGGSTGGSSGGSGGSSGGSSSHSGSSSGAGGSSGSSSSGVVKEAGAFDGGPAPVLFYDGGPVACGTPCDLKTQQCCLDSLALSPMCIAQSATCPKNDASFKCEAASDCNGSGMVCCGVANMTSASTACQAVAPGQCAPTSSSSSMGSAQLCASHAECAPGVQCVPQICNGPNPAVVLMAKFNLCGVHDFAPFNCTQTGPAN